MPTRPDPVINIDRLEPREIAAQRPGAPEKYRGATVAPISPLIGGQQLGYNLTSVPPGKCAFPAHNHYGNEEMFFILEGEGELRVGSRRFPLRPGDVVACPAGDKDSAHQILNTSDSATLRYLAVSTQNTPDLVQYPDSGKTGAAYFHGRDERGFPKGVRLLNREEDNLGYWDGE
jgi:uncharacterized cupin superfamily protein